MKLRMVHSFDVSIGMKDKVLRVLNTRPIYRSWMWGNGASIQDLPPEELILYSELMLVQERVAKDNSFKDLKLYDWMSTPKVITLLFRI